MIGVTVAIWFGYRAVFASVSLLYLAAGMAALWGLPRAVIGRDRSCGVKP
jgi:uncharacterized membrane protein YqjE